MTAYDVVVDALRDAGMRVAESSAGARSQCPEHGSRGLTLAVRPNPKNDDGPVQVTCFAGCETEDVLAQLGLGLRDLYDNNGERKHWGPPRPRPKPSPWDALFGGYLRAGDLDSFFDKVNRHLDAEGAA